MEHVEKLQTSFGDAFLSMPLLLIGFTFFFGLLTSNTGLIYLFLGHLLVVPSLTFLNNTAIPWMDGEKKSVWKLITWIFALSLTSVVNFAPFDTSAFTITKYILAPILIVLQLVSLNTNPPQKVEGIGCSIVPGIAPEDFISSRPSAWLSHISFFLSFVFTNAIGIFSEPSPQLLSTSLADDAARKKQQKNLDERVYNRKVTSAMIAGLSVLFLIVFLVFRYKTSCEGGFLPSLPGLLLTLLTGSSFYNLVYTYCGVRPADVLGIVQGMVNPELLDKPIVCVGNREP